MRQFAYDLRTSIRYLSRFPGFTLFAIVTVALGTGAASAVFTVVDGVFLQPLPYKDPERLVAVFESDLRRDEFRNPTSPANFIDWGLDNRSFDLLVAASPWDIVMNSESRPVRISGLLSTPGLFRLLGGTPQLGSLNESPGTVVLSYGLWQREFGGDPSVVGRAVRLNDQEHSVAAVMPRGFHFPPFWHESAEFWAPLILTPQQTSERGPRYLRVFGRLAESVTLEQTREEMSRRAQTLAERYSDDNRGITINVESLLEPVVSESRPALAMLSVAVGLLVLIATANLAGLLVARSTTRHGEIAVRLALGAGRVRLARQLLTESTVLALAGGVAGLVLGQWGLGLMLSENPGVVPRLGELTLDSRGVLFTFILALATGLAFGLAPVVASSDLRIAQILRSGVQGQQRRSRTLRSGLVVGQVALAVMLLTGTGLVLRSLLNLMEIDTGFRKSGVLTLDLILEASRHRTLEEQANLFDRIRRECASLPGVSGVALINHLPLGGDIWQARFAREGRAVTTSDDLERAVFRVVTPGYFQTIGIPLLSGQRFDGLETMDSEPRVIVNEAMARRLALVPSASPRISMGMPEADTRWHRVIGVVGNVRQWRLSDDIRPEVYFSYGQNPVSWNLSTSLVLATSQAGQIPIERLSEVIWNADRDIAIGEVRTIEDILGSELRRPRFNALLLGIFSTTALVLALAGVYGLLAFIVARQTRDRAIRMALGATNRDVLIGVLAVGFRLGIVGIGLGIGGSLMAGEWLSSRLYGVSSIDGPTLTAVSLTTLLVTVAACLVPAVRAAHLEPTAALKYE